MAVSPAILSQFQQAMREERYAQARSLAERALAASPNEAVAHDMVRAAHVGLTNYGAAVAPAQKVTELMPAHAGGWVSLGSILAALGRKQEAVAAFERAVDLEPDRAAHHTELCTALLNARRLSEAESACRRAIERFPGDTGLIFRLAAAQSEQGRPDDAAAVLGEALFSDPGNLHLSMTMCANSNYASGVDRATNAARHRNFGRLVMLADPRAPLKHALPKPGPAPAGFNAPGRGKDGRVRVGFLSSDLREHSVAWFIEPVLTHLDRARFEVVCYSNDPREDRVTRRLQRAVAVGPAAAEMTDDPPPAPDGQAPKGWRRIAMHDGYKAAKVIFDDRIDVLIELNGLTQGSRWDTLRLKPAPVQVTYCGYPNTTGIPTVDWRFVDGVTDPVEPAGVMDGLCVEKLLRMSPCFLCYRPPRGEDAPEARSAAGLPGAGAGGGIVFASFNNLTKVSPMTIAAWAAVLARVEGSTLLLKGTALNDESVRARVVGQFAAKGVDSSRLMLAPGTPDTRSHLMTYHRADIALDTFPYGGTTTTCEALFMGLPVVTLARSPQDGGTHAERVGASLVSCIGRAEWIASSVERYVETAATLADDHAKLAEHHARTRPALLASALCDQPAFGRRFGDAIALAWNAWVSGGAAKS